MCGDKLKWHPDKIWWVITGNCNLSCKHCYIEASETRFKQLDTDGCIALIKKAIRNGIKEFFITGGEPFIRKDILTIFSAIYEHGAKISGIDTNGLCLNEDIITFLINKEIRINISHDGIGVTGKNRRRNYEADLLNIITKLIERGVKVDVNTCVVEDNVEPLLQLAQHLEGTGIGTWFLFTPFESGSYIHNYRKPDVEKMSAVFRKLFQYWYESKPEYGIRLGNLYSSTGAEAQWETYQCEYFRDYIAVFPDGKVAPCCKYIQNENFGLFPDFITHDFEDILLQMYEFKNRSMSDFLKNNNECTVCKELSKCNGGCMMETTKYERHENKKDAYQCQLHKTFNLNHEVELQFDSKAY